MADQYGWPDEAECIDLVRRSAPEGLTEVVATDVPNLLVSVIAEFQSPVGRDGKGGTGRNFTPTEETRVFDGNGYPELRVDDIVPGEGVEVKVFDTTLVDVVLKQAIHGLGFNVLSRPQSSGAILGTSYGLSGLFPLGKQNVRVTTTWGFAAQVPKDVWKAVRGEVAYMALVGGAVGIDGVGQKVKIGSYELDTAAGSRSWEMSSPLAVYHNDYQQTVKRYRDTGTWRFARLGKRMS